ncbi:hypothetical protein [Mycolicibacter longobardus]|uniref:Low molecular weight antigen MTB12-like C-terminal domain-containing protein n=1 Tax=Mycolicibacter longobardus TaxID=1108812 RepID=A0A1X1YN52_9MYCO|nr:hypothetical protein [Mycolicibacter longobardus]MCV7385096.1 hypothetical protein [Mycolicibacter longobardus]ORW12482.1 hypothetical protein AWC16_08815 [Mycolicibacter longobardus]
MYRSRIAVSTALAAVLALSGCGRQQPAEPVAEMPLTATTTVSAPAPAAPLPAPEALTDVLYRLSDPEVPGVDKVPLIEGAKSTDAETIEKFATALRDGGYLPLSLEAAGVTWSDRYPGNVSADVTVNTANPATGGFFFPMEFRSNGEGWQLSQATAKTLLAFGKSQASSAAPAPPTP